MLIDISKLEECGFIVKPAKDTTHKFYITMDMDNRMSKKIYKKATELVSEVMKTVSKTTRDELRDVMIDHYIQSELIKFVKSI